MYLYEKLHTAKLSLELAYSIPYLVDTDMIIGTEIVTFKPVTVWSN